MKPSIDVLERRELCAATPTDYEQYMLALINRARANPAAEGQRLLSLAQTDPVLIKATQNWNLNTFVQTISANGPLPPLAFNTRLIEAADAENARMLALNSQDHSPKGFLTNAAVATAPDGQAYYDVNNASWATGENIFAYSANVNANSTLDYVNYFHAAFLIDWGNPDFGHLKNLMAPGPSTSTATNFPLSEIGLSVVTDVLPTVPPDPNPSNPANAGLNVGPAMVAQEFGWRSTGNPILTGTVYNDRNQNSFYDPGEGYGGVTIKAVGRNGQGTFQVNTWDSGGYSLPLPSGSYDVTASGGSFPGSRTTFVTISKDNVGWDANTTVAPPPPDPAKADIPVVGDFDGDRKMDVAVFRPQTAEWIYQRSSNGQSVTIPFGTAGLDIPVPGRYDGGTRTELAVYRPTTGEWLISGPTGVRVVSFGAPGVDLPEPGDYDGDGKTDLAVYRPTTGQWLILQSKTNRFQIKQLGLPGNDQPVPADYDGDGKVDPAVYRQGTAQWVILQSRTGKSRIKQFGAPGTDQPVPADFDGDKKADLALFRPSTGQWLILRSKTNKPQTLTFGVPGLDVPRPADFDGDKKADLAIYRSSTAQWILLRSKAGFVAPVVGQAGTPQSVSAILSKTTPIPSGWVGWNPPTPAGKHETSGLLTARKVRTGRPAVLPHGPDQAFQGHRHGKPQLS